MVGVARPVLFVFWAVAGLLGLSVGAAAEAVRVSEGDTLELRVVEWNPVEEALEDWPALSGEYVVTFDGRLNIPFIGSVPAAGRLPEAIAVDISRGLGESLALTEAPHTAVTIVGFRPVVVSGLVQEAGEVPFSAGMTVRHAVALAGGPDDVLRTGTDALREIIRTEGRLRLLSQEKLRLDATYARLSAERVGAAEITAPPGFSGERAERLLAEESEILASRRNRLALDRQALTEQIVLLRAEITSLEEQLRASERQREIARNAREGVSSLASDGLVANTRILESERALASIENQVLEISTALLRARQALTESGRELETIEADRVTEVIEEMIRVDARRTDLQLELETLSRLTEVGELRLAEMLEANAAAPRGEAVFTIYRLSGEEISATGATQLEPGDFVEVSRSTLDADVSLQTGN